MFRLLLCTCTVYPYFAQTAIALPNKQRVAKVTQGFVSEYPSRPGNLHVVDPGGNHPHWAKRCPQSQRIAQGSKVGHTHSSLGRKSVGKCQ